jgi:hypothetical protein
LWVWATWLHYPGEQDAPPVKPNIFDLSGAPGEIRTHNRLIRSKNVNSASVLFAYLYS